MASKTVNLQPQCQLNDEVENTKLSSDDISSDDTSATISASEDCGTDEDGENDHVRTKNEHIILNSITAIKIRLSGTVLHAFYLV